jgi:hypothetical protein
MMQFRPIDELREKSSDEKRVALASKRVIQLPRVEHTAHLQALHHGLGVLL